MKCNVAIWDRWLRFIFGLLLTTWAIAGGPAWAFFGLYLFFTAGWGFCFFYAFFKINTIRELKNFPRRNPKP